MMCFIFFFQAEDGIRYYKVTGVQTCALPICSGDRRHRPIGDDRNGGGQIQRNLPEISDVVQERTQCAGHELRSLPVQSWRLALYEPHNIAGTQMRKRDSSGTETVLEKTADERNVVDDGRAGQCAHFQQILPECLGTILSRSRVEY